MKIATILLIFLFLSTNLLLGQNEVPSQPFVKLKNGQLYLGSNLQIDKYFFKSDILTLDSLTFKAKKVEFYKNNGSILYGSIGNLTKSVYEGNGLYIFTKTSTAHVTQGTASTGYSPRTFGGNTTYYFSRGIGKIKVMNATNLLPELSDEPEAYRLIIDANKNKRYSRIAFAASISLMAFTITSGLRQPGNPFITSKLPPLAMAGGLIGSYLLTQKKKKLIKQAIKAYNGFDKAQ